VSRLPEIQEAFQHFLLEGKAEISAHVLGTNRVPVETRLGIYGDAYKARLSEALEASFPVLAQLLGEHDFQELASRYVSGHESTFFSIRYYGDRMAEFLATHPQYAKAPLLCELARWEWAMAEAFDAADADPIGPEAFGQISPEEWEQLRFEWHPSVQVLHLEWNVPQIWKTVTEGPADETPSEGTEPLLEPSSWLIWRRDLQIFFRPLVPMEAVSIEASRAGQSFGELCMALCEHLEETESSRQAAGFLRGWVESGLISSII
jgi:hypothetical protein